MQGVNSTEESLGAWWWAMNKNGSPCEAERGEGRLLGNFPGQRKEILREEALSKVLLCAVGGYLWPEQTDLRGWSYLVGNGLFVPSCFL